MEKDKPRRVAVKFDLKRLGEESKAEILESLGLTEKYKEVKKKSPLRFEMWGNMDEGEFTLIEESTGSHDLLTKKQKLIAMFFTPSKKQATKMYDAILEVLTSTYGDNG